MVSYSKSLHFVISTYPMKLPLKVILKFGIKVIFLTDQFVSNENYFRCEFELKVTFYS